MQKMHILLEMGGVGSGFLGVGLTVQYRRVYVMLPVVTKILTKAKVEKLSQDKERAMVFGPHLKNYSYFGRSTK